MSTQVEIGPGDDEEVATATKSFAQDESVVRKSCCRYGSGCTHINDPAHREKFWHPYAPRFSGEQLKSNFICNECGYGTSNLAALQLHLQRKTAWSNVSLIGCRINCLVDYKEWHEGVVLQFHKSGKHYVEFRQVNEKRWLIMKKIAFYILERPPPSVTEEGEFKDDSDCEGLAPVEDDWVYCEDITLEYAFAQSVLFKIYGNNIQETGHLTRGHTCLTDADRLHAQYVKGSLLYGELLPRGANKAFGPKRLATQEASVLFDLGMGTGKILIQAFLQFKNLRYIFGIELSNARYKLAEEAVLRMVKLLGTDGYHVQLNPGKFIIVTEVVRTSDDPAEEGNNYGDHSSRCGGASLSASAGATPRDAPRSASNMEDDIYGVNGHRADADSARSHTPTRDHTHIHSQNRSRSNSADSRRSHNSDNHSHNHSGRESPAGDGELYIERVLHFQFGNMFDVQNINTADIVMMETDVPQETHTKLLALLAQMKADSRMLSYLDLRKLWTNSHLNFQQLEVNRHQADRYPTSWSVQRGHHFYLWSRVDHTRAVEGGGLSSSWEWGRIGNIVTGSGAGAGNGAYTSSDSPILPRSGSQLAGQHSPQRSGAGSGKASANRITTGRTFAAAGTGAAGAGTGAASVNVDGVTGGAPNTQDSDGTEMSSQDGRCLSLSWIFSFRRRRSSTGSSGGGRAQVKSNGNVRRITVSEHEAGLATNERAVIPLHLDGRITVREYAVYMDALNSKKETEKSATAAAAASAAPAPVEPLQIPHSATATFSTSGASRVTKIIDINERITTTGTESVRLKSPRPSPRDSPRGSKKKKGSKADRHSPSHNSAGEAVDNTSTAPSTGTTAAGLPSKASEDPAGAILQRVASITRTPLSRNNSTVRNSTSLDSLHNFAPNAALQGESLVLDMNSQANSPSPVLSARRNSRTPTGNGSAGVMYEMGFGTDVRSSLSSTPPQSNRAGNSSSSNNGGSARSPGNITMQSPNELQSSACSGGEHTTTAGRGEGSNSVNERERPSRSNRRDTAEESRRANTHITYVETSLRNKEKHRKTSSGQIDPLSLQAIVTADTISGQAAADANLLAESTHSGKSASCGRERSNSPKPVAAQQAVEAAMMHASADRASSGGAGGGILAKQRSSNGRSAVGATTAGRASSLGRKQRADEASESCSIS